MSDSPTPETDAEAMDGICCYGDPLKSWDYKQSNDGEVVPAEFARRLERERNEAGKALFEITWKIPRQIDEALKERDEARRERDEAKGIISILVRRRIILWEDVDSVLEQINEEKEEAK